MQLFNTPLIERNLAGNRRLHRSQRRPRFKSVIVDDNRRKRFLVNRRQRILETSGWKVREIVILP